MVSFYLQFSILLILTPGMWKIVKYNKFALVKSMCPWVAGWVSRWVVGLVSHAMVTD